MRVFIVVVCILFAGSLLAPGVGHAQVFDNEIGLYTDLSASHASTSILIEPNVLFHVYAIVTNPFNEEFVPADCVPPIQRDITLIDAFQLRLIKSGVGLYTLEAIPNGGATTNIGFLPDYAFGFSEPLQVPEDRVTHLITFTFMVADSDPKELFLEPTVSLPSNNFLGIYDAQEYVAWPRDCPWDGPYQICHPVSGDCSMPVFGINTSVVATENVSFGSVKALYR